jgi:hypothetical protein
LDLIQNEERMKNEQLLFSWLINKFQFTIRIGKIRVEMFLHFSKSADKLKNYTLEVCVMGGNLKFYYKSLLSNCFQKF